MADPGAVRAPAGVDTYQAVSDGILHEIHLDQLVVSSKIEDLDPGPDAKGAWWRAYLEGRRPAPVGPERGTLRVADLFSGSGGLANGVAQLAAELGRTFVAELVADHDEAATRVYAANHSTRRPFNESIKKLVEYQVAGRAADARFAYPPELLDSEMAELVGSIDVVLAGPPCQGHSNLNNATRRSDPRNDLYLTVPAFVLATRAPICIIENVPSVLNDESAVVEVAVSLFQAAGYHVTQGLLTASDMGWPQTRKRHFLVARKDAPPAALDDVGRLLADEPRSVWWAISDLEYQVGDETMSSLSELSERNQERIDYLFENDQYDLALKERPDSHKDGTTYTAVYGRMRKDDPAPTITTGFMSPGRGRFTHPTQRRVLTPREAARIQGFPDTYRFALDPANPPNRRQLAKWIGDAVPMPLGYAAALAAFAPGMLDSD